MPGTSGTRPVIANAGTTLTLGSGNTLRGFNATNTAGTGITGAAFGNLTVSEVSVTASNSNGACAAAVNLSTGNPTASFTAISATNCTNGIVLSSTTGSFTVTGTGGAGTGGTIQNSTGNGIALSTAAGVSLSWMNIQTSGDDGINGTTVNGCSLSDSSVINNGNSTTDEGIEFDNLIGTASLTNATVTGNAHNNFDLDNSSGTLASLTVTGGSFSSNVFVTGNHGFLFQARLTAVVTAVNISNATFSNNVSIGMQVLTGDTATISSYIVSNCTFSDTGTGNSQEIAADFSTAQTSNMTYKFLNNTLTGHNSQAFNTFTAAGAGTGGTLNGTIEGNTIGNQAVIDSGSKIGNGMRININGGATARIKVNNNTLRQIPTGRGIEAIARNGTGGASFIITNNTVAAPTATAQIVCVAGVLCPLAPIHVQTNTVTVANNACSVVSGNTAYDPTTVPGGLGAESSVQLIETSTSSLTYEGNGALTALQNLTNANPGCVTKDVVGTVAVVAAGTCAMPPAFAPPIEADGQSQNAALIAPDTGGGSNSSTLLTRVRRLAARAFSAFAAPTNYLIAGKLSSWIAPTVSAAERKSNEGPAIVSRSASAHASPARTMLINSKGEYAIVPSALLSGELITINGGGGGFTLPAGENTTIMFNATISSSFTGPSIANQATVMAAGPITVMSNNLMTEVFQPVTIAKAFSPSSIVTGNSSNLTLTLTNPNAVNQTGASFTDTLVNMSAVGGGVTGTCVGTTPNTLAANATALSFSGITVPASTSCTVIFAVKSSTLGTNPNTTSAVATTQAPTGGVASNTANLLVFATPTIAKAFNPALISSGGTSTVTLTLSNTNATALTGASFTDTLTNMTALGGAVTGTCVGTTPNTLAANATALSFSGITIPASDGCTVIFDVTSSSPGVHPNTTSGVTTTQTTPTAGPVSNTAVLTVPDAPKLAKAFFGTQATNFIYALSTTNTLTGFNPSTPGTPGGSVTITGLVVGDTVMAIDFRLATGELYGLGVNGTTAHLYTINTTTGVAIQVGGNITVSGTNFGFAFNPVDDRIRVVSESNINLRLNPNDGTVTTDTMFNPGDPDIVGVAYSSNFAGAPSTSLFGIDSTTDTLVQHNPPNTGTLVPIGALGVNTSAEVGLDIANDLAGTAYASLQVGGVSGLYTINLGTGAATLVGALGGGITARDIAVVTQIPVGGTATLSFAVTNPNAAISLSNISFSDILPSGLQVDATPMPTNTCGGAFNPMPGDMTVSFSGGVLASSTSCNLSVKVRGTMAGVKINTTGPISSTESGAGGTATARLNVTKASTTLTSITDSPDPSVTGQPYTVGFTLNVTPPGMGTPTGTVTVTDGTGGMCIATLPATNCLLTSTSMGVKTLVITYSGDSNFNGSNTTAGHQVNKANTTTAVASSQNPSVFGQPVTFTATVAAVSPGSGTPTGIVTFIIDGGVVIMIPLVGGQAMQASTALTVAGSPHSVVVNYSGDPSYNTSTGALAGGQVVNKANTTTTIVSDNPDSSAVGQNVTVAFAVVATAPGGGTPGGNVVVTVSGGVETCTGTVGAGSCVITLTTPGARTLTATYAGDGNFNGGNDTEPHTVVAPPSIAKVFTPPTTPVGGTSTLTFTITNPVTNTVALTGVGFTDNFPTPPELVVATPLTTTNTCGGTLTDNTNGALAAGDVGIKLVGGMVSISGTCTVSVNVTPTMPGPFVNITGNVSSTNGGTGNTATATLLTNTPPTISSNNVPVKAGSNAASFTIATATDPDQPVNTLGITINGNPTTASSNGVTVSGVTITPSGIVTANVSTTCAATSAMFNLVVTDNQSATGTGILTVTVTPNMPPMLGYAPQTVTAGTTPLFGPAVGPSDNGTINQILLQSVIPNNGGLTLAVNPMTGQVLVTGASLIGSYMIDIAVTDNCMATTVASFMVNVVCPAITLNPATLPNGTVNSAYPQSLTASPAGGNYNFGVTSGLLPNGLTLNGNGTFSGAPTQSGVFNFRVTAAGFGGCTGFRDYSITVICPTITLSPGSLPGGTVGTAYSQAVSASPAGTYSYSVSSGALPTGLTLNTSTGALTGTPTTTGTFSFTIRAAAGSCTGSQSYTIVVVCPTIGLSPASLPNGQAGNAYSQALAVTPAGTYSFSIVLGALPSGLTLHPTTGVMSGLPFITGTYNFTVRADAGNGCLGTQAYALVIVCPAITVSPATLPAGTQNVFYSQTISATPAGGSYTFTRTSGAFPTGLTFNAGTGVLSGFPTANGTFNFTMTATGFGSCTGSQSYTVVIGGGGCPAITLPATLGNGSVGAAYVKSVAASPSGVYSYAVTGGSLPPGVTLYGSFGLLFGYPTTPGTYNFTITATNASSCTASQMYTVMIGAAGSMLSTGVTGLAVVSAASYQPETTTPGGIVAAFGSDLAVSTELAATVPLPTELAGTRVFMRDAAGVEYPAPLFFVSPQQVNFQIPDGASLGEAVLMVASGDGSISVQTTMIVPVAPGLFAANADGAGAPAGFFVHVAGDNSQVLESTAAMDSLSGLHVPSRVVFGASPEELFLVLHGTGFRGRSLLEAVTVRVGGVAGEVTYAGVQEGYAGLDQINVRLPRSLVGRGEVEIEVIIDGRVANTLRIHLR